VKSCESCAANVCNDTKCCLDCEIKGVCICYSCIGFSNYKPNYQALEAENAELKQELEVLRRRVKNG
jgi:hypothetical protein